MPWPCRCGYRRYPFSRRDRLPFAASPAAPSGSCLSAISVKLGVGTAKSVRERAHVFLVLQIPIERSQRRAAGEQHDEQRLFLLLASRCQSASDQLELVTAARNLPFGDDASLRRLVDQGTSKVGPFGPARRNLLPDLTVDAVLRRLAVDLDIMFRSELDAISAEIGLLRACLMAAFLPRPLSG